MELQNQKVFGGIKILSIGTDKNLFKENSDVRKRIIDYGAMADEFHIIILTKKSVFKTADKNQISNNTFIYPTSSLNKLFYVFDAYKIVKSILIKNLSVLAKQSGAGKLEVASYLITCQDPFETGLVGWLIKKKFSAKVSSRGEAGGSVSGGKISLQLQIHTDFLSPYFSKESFLNKIRVLLAKFLIPRADGIRVVSQRIKNSLLQVSSFKFQASRISVLPIYVDVKKIKETAITVDLREKYSRFDFIILMASRLTKEKNIGLTIDAMAEVIKEHPKTGLIIVGDGPEKENQKSKIKNQKLENNIIFEDAVLFDKLISYYKTADLFLLTSNYEGYGRTVVEAMAASCPVLMTDVGIANEILINKKDGFVVSVDDKQELIRTLSALIADNELRKNFTVNSDKIVNFWPSYEEYLRNYYNSWMSCAKK